jgi:Flp pilus assembly pilin Flp
MSPNHPHITKLTEEHGQTMTETAVLLALIVLIVMVAVSIFGTSLANLWNQLSSALPTG